MEEKVTSLEFETLRNEYRRKDARGIPMSVRERYEKALSALRNQIRKERIDKKENRLGEILVELGFLDQNTLQSGLTEQHQRTNGKLLGEILLLRGAIEEKELLLALHKQVNKS